MKLNKVLLFGGSYNPIHQGHINAALNASKFLKCDEIWLMPRKYNYDGSLLLDAKHRIAMINMALDEFDNFKICDIELKDKNKKLIYTYNTAKILHKKYSKQYEFYFLIGADQLNNIERWYEIDKLTKLFKFVCFKRPGYVINDKLATKYNIIIIDGNQIDASSTNVRAGYFDKVDEDIQQYIKDNELYLKERLMPLLDEKLFMHCLSTARLAKELAISLHENANRAYVAGILHDISKSLPEDEIMHIINNNYPSKKNNPKYCLHQYASDYIAKNTMGIKDKKTLKAISSHCRATLNMSKLDKIIYCADKLEETRKFADSVKSIRDIAYTDIDKAFILTLKDQIEYLKKNNQKIDNHIIKVLNHYEKEVKYGG